MSVCGCCNTISNKWNECVEAKDQWIGKKVAWLIGEGEYSETTKMAVNSLASIFGISAILTMMISSVYKESLSDDTKIAIIIPVGVVFISSIITSLFNEIIYRYQPSPPLSSSFHIVVTAQFFSSGVRH